MDIGKVVGTVVATRKDESLVGAKLLITQPLDLAFEPVGQARLMVDSVGAGVGEIVIYATGQAARNALKKREAAIDAAIVGIVDSCEIDPILAGKGKK
ncbi:MAG: EutN/CcmL family microcompartment protein [Deltaproteobacteria bacterium]|jgi:ethanolamine utilization protein EutN|nr:EutN/CcmL family microcompartment protein [Deltaproteobacteria bacterium]